MQNSSEIMLLPGRQLRLLVCQKMCLLRLSALQGVWICLKVILVLKHRVQLKMGLFTLKHQSEEIVKQIRGIC